MAEPVVLSPYALSGEERLILEQSLGATPTYRSIAELRRLPPRQIFRALRAEGADRCVVPLMHAGSRSLLPLLHTFATVAGFARVDAVSAGQRIESLAAWRVPGSVAAVTAATAANQVAVRLARRELTALLAVDRRNMPRESSREVLYVSANLWFGLSVGGSVGHTAGVVNGLIESGHDVALASLSAPPALLEAVRPIQLHAPKTLGVPFESNSYRFGRGVTRQLAPVVSRGGLAFLYQRMSVANYTGVVLSRRANVPLVLEYNGSEVWTARHWGRPLRNQELAIAAEDACLRHAHLVVTVSDVLRDELVDRGVEPERVVSYPNCVDPGIFDPDRFDPCARRVLRAKLGVSESATLVTFVGTFGQWHGVDVLARAIVRMIEDSEVWLEDRQVRFLLVGDGLKRGEVEEVLASNPRSSRFVVRAGLVPQAEAAAHLAISDVMVSPHVPNPDGSRFFGSPTKLFEYMAMGKPIVASKLDQIGEVLSPGLDASSLPVDPPTQGTPELAVLARPGSVTELVRGITFAVEHSDWGGVLGSNARARALGRFTWRHHVSAILERLHAVVPD